MDIVNDQGVIQYVENATVVNNNTYVGFFISPNEEFKVQVSGTDDNGFRFSYISDVSVEPTTISLQLTGKKLYTWMYGYVCTYMKYDRIVNVYFLIKVGRFPKTVAEVFCFVARLRLPCIKLVVKLLALK